MSVERTTSDLPRILIFRKRMLPYSETFVAAPATYLTRWIPVFSGATLDKSGYSLLKNADTCILSQNVFFPWRSIAARLFKSRGWIPGKWLKALKSFRPRLIHVHFGPDALFMGVPLAKALNIPLVVTFHGFDITINRPDSAYQKLRPLLFEKATKVIAVSQYIKDQLIAHGCPPEKIVSHYIGIDLAQFRPLEADIKRSDIVFTGRLTEKKGCRYLIEAVIRLHASGLTPKLHLIGDGGLREELEELARPLGDHVIFHGSQSPDFVREMVGRAAIFCAPSVTSRNGDSEGLGMVNLEAMALGTPVVSTLHAAIPEAVIHEETGILVPEHDSAALAIALTRLLRDENLARELGQNGIAHVRRNFDLKPQCIKLEAIYDELIVRSAH